MSIKQYRFVSPGVFVKEIDNSQLPEAPVGIGPLVIGRADRGPSMRPVELTAFSEFIELFGNPVPGNIGGDVWRDGNRTSPMYGGYAAQAYMANKTPLTYLRLLGYHHPDRTGAVDATAGWDGGDAYGLFVGPPGGGDCALAAVVYVPGGESIGLSGTGLDGTTTVSEELNTFVQSQASGLEFTLSVDGRTCPFNFLRTSKKFIRRALNTNPTLTNGAVTDSDAQKDYWLGETYEAHLDNILDGSLSTGAGNAAAILLKLNDGIGTASIFDKADLKIEAQSPLTSWIFSQHTETHDLMSVGQGSMEVEGTKKLFRFAGLNDGAWSSRKLKIGLADIKASEDEFNPYGTFTVIVRVTEDSDNAPEFVERYANCNLNPASSNYIGAKIGDMDSTWDYAEGRYIMTGNHQNRSRFVRVEIDPDVDAGVTDAELLPFGFYGPATPRQAIITAGIGQEPGEEANADDGSVTGANLKDTVNNGIVSAVDLEGADIVGSALGGETYRLIWPAASCRQSSVFGNLSNGTRSYFGVTSNQASNGVKVEPSYGEVMRPYSSTHSTLGTLIDPVGVQAIPQLYSDGAFDGDAFTQLVDLTLTWTDDSSAAAPFPLPDDPLLEGNTVTIGVGSGPTNTTFEFDTAGDGVGVGNEEVDATGTLAETLQNLVDAINTVLSADVLASLEAQDNSPDGPTSSYIICLKGLSEDACDGLALSAVDLTGVADNLTVAATVNTCIANDVKRAAGDFFANGIVPYFSLDDLVMQDSTVGSVTSKSRQHVDWKPGSRYAGASVTVRGTDQAAYDSIPCGPPGLGDKPGTYRDILEHGYDQFSLPLMGGFDGLNVVEKDPFRNTLLADETELTHYAFNSVKRGIDTVADPEVLDMNLAAVPGITNPALTTHLTEVCRDRADALAVIDIENDYVPRHEGTQAEEFRLPDVDQAVTSLKDRRINNSYACTYFPWVQARDNFTNSVLWVPPSVVALGTMAYSDTRAGSDIWFAPAGFNRGGLTGGAAGIPVTNVRYRLTSKERDKLYEANINPIASFPSEGIVVFGNKTLQVTPSALDRVNVRRLMLFLKKEVSRIANQILFDQNVQVTWKRFTSEVNPLLASVQSRFGLTEFKVVLDETTTTPDLIDRNILYAKIFLKPARAIEFIAIDFNIARTGASFAD